jgi:hypothetical protein
MSSPVFASHENESYAAVSYNCLSDLDEIPHK